MNITGIDGAVPVGLRPALLFVDRCDTVGAAMTSDRNPEEDEIPFAALALDALRATAAPQLLVEAPAGAVVLERIARGAGATRWFRLGDERDLEQLAGRLSPGSSVSFYFDGRLASSVYDSSVGRALLAIAVQDGDAVIGRLGDDQFEINVDLVASAAELEEYASELPSGAEVIYGRFPASDNDGLRAVTIDLPDRDGVVRPHPH